jgi:MFS family permease
VVWRAAQLRPAPGPRRAPDGPQPGRVDGMSGLGGSIHRPLRNRSFRAVWVSLLLSSLGDWAARLALAILVLDRTHSASLSSLVVALSFLPWLGPGQVLATRLAHRPGLRVMVGADLIRSAMFALLLIPLPTWALLALVLVASLATPPFDAARSAVTAEVVDAEEYGSAVALLDMTEQSAVIVGYLVGGASVLAGGVATALVVNVASFLLSAAVLSRVAGGTGRGRPEPVGSQLGRGVRIILADVVIRRGLLALLIAALPAAAIEATAAVYARFVLHVGSDVTGVLAAAVPVGILVTVPLLPRSGSARRLICAGAAAAMAGGLVGGAGFGAGRMAGAIVGYLAAGVLSASATPAQIAFQPRIASPDRPAVFSVAQGLVMGAQAVGAAAGGILAAAAGPRRAAVGWMAAVVVLAGLSMLRPLPVAVGPEQGANRRSAGDADGADGADGADDADDAAIGTARRDRPGA